jgi:hypothetical protein
MVVDGVGKPEVEVLPHVVGAAQGFPVNSPLDPHPFIIGAFSVSAAWCHIALPRCCGFVLVERAKYWLLAILGMNRTGTATENLSRLDAPLEAFSITRRAIGLITFLAVVLPIGEHRPRSGLALIGS